jgi:hypothetical protein
MGTDLHRQMGTSRKKNRVARCLPELGREPRTAGVPRFTKDHVRLGGGLHLSGLSWARHLSLLFKVLRTRASKASPPASVPTPNTASVSEAMITLIGARGNSMHARSSASTNSSSLHSRVSFMIVAVPLARSLTTLLPRVPARGHRHALVTIAAFEVPNLRQILTTSRHWAQRRLLLPTVAVLV